MTSKLAWLAISWTPMTLDEWLSSEETSHPAPEAELDA